MSDVDQFFENLDTKFKPLAAKIRSIVKTTLPQAAEKIKWGNPTYIVSGKNVAWILAYRNHLDLDFFQGAKLKSLLLEGTGKSLRHIKIRSEEDVKEKEFIRLIKEATKLT